MLRISALPSFNDEINPWKESEREIKREREGGREGGGLELKVSYNHNISPGIRQNYCRVAERYVVILLRRETKKPESK